MSKISKILVACAAMTALATPAMAIDADFTGFLQTRGVAYDNMNGNDDVDDNGRGVDSRYRLWTNTALNENVKAVFALEVDYVWGDTGSGGKEVGKIGADAKGQIEIKNIYLDFNVPTWETNFKVGTQYLVLGDGLLLGGDDSTGVNARYTPVKGQSLYLVWVKAVENDLASDADDADYYQVQYDVDVADWRVSPFVGWYDLTDGDDVFYLGASANGKMGPLALNATAIVNDGDNDTEDISGVSARVNAKYAMGPTSLIGEAGYAGDSGTATGEFFDVTSYNPFAEIVSGGRFDARGTVGTNTNVNGQASTRNAGYYANYIYGKLGAEHKYNDMLKVSAYYIYSEEAQDPTGRDALTYGHELDAYADMEVVKGLTFTVGGGYLIADERVATAAEVAAGSGAIVDADDAWKLGTALTYKF